jgi:hypothetical protein
MKTKLQMNRDFIVKQFHDRIGVVHPISPQVRISAAECLYSAWRCEDKVAEIATDRTLTDSGQQQARAKAVPDALKEYCRHQRQINKLNAEVKSLEAAVQAKSFGSPDGPKATLLSDYRRYLLSLSLGERQQEAASTQDPLMMEAMLSHPKLCGMTGNLAPLIPEIRARWLQLTCPDELKVIEEMKAVVAEGSAAAQLAKNIIRQTSGMEERAFNKLAEPIEKQFGAPWLLKSTNKSGAEQVMVVEGEAGAVTYRPATTDEIAYGVFYKNIAEYQEARAPA